MIKLLIPSISLIAALLVPSTGFSSEVYTWRNQNGHTAYSDVPQRLQPTRSHIMNVRTHTVYQAATSAQTAASSGSLADQQSQLNKKAANISKKVEEQNQKISEANKKIEEQNQKIAEQNQQQKDDNCKAARLNRQYAESARTNNREALKQRYDEDISKYCN